jgi:hypothetical protein
MCNKSRIITCKLLETAAATAYNVPTDDSSRQTMVIVLRSFANLLRCMVGNVILLGMGLFSLFQCAGHVS